MTESWAPPPSSTAISSGLLGSVSGMFPCNSQFQIRNQENIDQRDPYKTRHNLFETLYLSCVCSAIHMSDYVHYMQRDFIGRAIICSPLLYIWRSRHRRPWRKKSKHHHWMAMLFIQWVSPDWWQRPELHPHPPHLFRLGSSSLFLGGFPAMTSFK